MNQSKTGQPWLGRNICRCLREPVGGTIWEGGHFYASKGPTVWSVVGWNLLEGLKTLPDHTMVMVDDVHPIELLHPAERDIPIVADFNPRACITVLESAMTEPGREVLSFLTTLPRRRRARYVQHRWCCSGRPLTVPNGDKAINSATPLCLLYDLGLILLKSQMGFQRAVNVLPEFYEPEQRSLIRIARKVVPEFRIEAVLYGLNGKWRRLRPEDVF